MFHMKRENNSLKLAVPTPQVKSENKFLQTLCITQPPSSETSY